MARRKSSLEQRIQSERYMSRIHHRDFVSISGDISQKLQEAITECGPISKPQPHGLPLPVVMCRTIAGQQLSVQAARTIWSRVLADSQGEPLMEYLPSVEVAQLRACGLSRAKGRSMKAIADAFATDQLSENLLKRLPHTERSARLTAIWGVGQWTADMLGIFYFGERDIWPDTDVTVWKTLQRLTSRRRKTTLTAAKFSPQRSLLAKYLWRIADASPNKD